MKGTEGHCDKHRPRWGDTGDMDNMQIQKKKEKSKEQRKTKGHRRDNDTSNKIITNHPLLLRL